MRRSLFAVSLALWWINGCSFAFVSPRREGKLNQLRQPDCSTEYVGPILDTLLIVPGAYFAGRAVTRSYNGALVTRPTDLLLGVGLMVGVAASALWGYHTVSDCRDAYVRQGIELP